MIGMINSRAYCDSETNIELWVSLQCMSHGQERLHTLDNSSYISFEYVRYNTFIQNNDPIKCTQPRHDHRIYINFFCISTRSEPALTLDTSSILLHIYSIRLPLHCRRITIHTSRTVQFVTKCNNEAVQMLNICFAIPANGILKTSVGLLSQRMCCLVWKKRVFGSCFRMESVANTV